MDEKRISNEKECTPLMLNQAMLPIIERLRSDRKFPAVHIYACVLRSFTRFSSGKEVVMLDVGEVFMPGRLKEYEAWLRSTEASWNTVSTYMRTLRAVYNRLVMITAVPYVPGLFDDVYTKVEPLTKRALTEQQMQVLMFADVALLPQKVRCALAYFLLTFFFRGMPFIDLAYLQKRDVKGDFITYCRHKTGRQITVRIPSQARCLLEEFRNENSSSIYLLPILDIEDAQAASKSFDDECLYLRYLRALANFNRHLLQVATILLPSAKLSSYTPRHTWATLAFYQGVYIGIISKALGHSSIKVTENYLKPFENAKVDAANDELIVSIKNSSNGRFVA